jgi:hypothetical protein
VFPVRERPDPALDPKIMSCRFDFWYVKLPVEHNVLTVLSVTTRSRAVTANTP